jgi:hypothetical protein
VGDAEGVMPEKYTAGQKVASRVVQFAVAVEQHPAKGVTRDGA